MKLRFRTSKILLLALLAMTLPPAIETVEARDKRIDELPVKYRQWLEDVDVLISKRERKAFLEVEKDYQRDAFIERFWKSRDPEPGTERNELRDLFTARLAEARERYVNKVDDRFKVFLFNGDPGEIFETQCGLLLWPLEVWRYSYSRAARGAVTVIFTQRNGGGPFKMWRPVEGYGELMGLGSIDSSNPAAERATFYENVLENCTEIEEVVFDLLRDFRTVEREGPNGPVRAETPPTNPDPEWIESFYSFSTEASEDAPPLVATVDYRFAGKHQSRVVVEGLIRVEAEQATPVELAGRTSYNLQLTGEVLRGDELFESFRYRFDLPQTGSTEPLSMLFERYLRPGDYTVVLKLDDVHGGGSFREERTLTVPAVGEVVAALEQEDPEEALAEEVGPPVRLDLSTENKGLRAGYSRFTAQIEGEVSKVTFLLDGKAVMTKTRPPFGVELDLGSRPRMQTVRAIAYDAAGRQVATDEVLLNPGEHSFLVRLVEPERGGSYRGEVRARVQVETPEDEGLERLEIFLNEDRLATLYQPPFVQTVHLEGSDPVYIRAVAYLEDGNSTEDLVLINAGDYLENVDVTLVELFATVVDSAGDPVLDLDRDEVKVLESGAPQELVRFERMDNLPIYAALLVDTSASMAENLTAVRDVALGFFRQTIESKDRAAVITFSEEPRLAARFTNDLDKIAGALASVNAERSTALYDSVMFGLYYFQGIRGQRALVILSDGEDRRSETSFEEMLDYARSAGVTIYAIGVEISKRSARSRLSQLAEETGGRSFFIKEISELEAVTATIQRDLRSRYFLAFQSPPGNRREFRPIEVRVGRAGAEVRTVGGYYP